MAPLKGDQLYPAAGLGVSLLEAFVERQAAEGLVVSNHSLPWSYPSAGTVGRKYSISSNRRKLEVLICSNSDMTLTIHRQARVDAQRRISLRHAAFRPGTMVDVVAVAPRARVDKPRSPAYSLFDQLQTLASKLNRQWSSDGMLQAGAGLPADYSLNFEQTLDPRRG